MRRLAITLALCLAPAASAHPGEPACRIPGHAIQWIADYCMFKLETDDVIAASDCIEAQGSLRFRTACVAKIHFKTEFCRLARAREARKGSLAACVADEDFKGKSVAGGA